MNVAEISSLKLLSNIYVIDGGKLEKRIENIIESDIFFGGYRDEPTLGLRKKHDLFLGF